jgi:hypothetical protein
MRVEQTNWCEISQAGAAEVNWRPTHTRWEPPQLELSTPHRVEQLLLRFNLRLGVLCLLYPPCQRSLIHYEGEGAIHEIPLIETMGRDDCYRQINGSMFRNIFYSRFAHFFSEQ